MLHILFHYPCHQFAFTVPFNIKAYRALVTLLHIMYTVNVIIMLSHEWIAHSSEFNQLRRNQSFLPTTKPHNTLTYGMESWFQFQHGHYALMLIECVQYVTYMCNVHYMSTVSVMRSSCFKWNIEMGFKHPFWRRFLPHFNHTEWGLKSMVPYVSICVQFRCRQCIDN